MSPSPPDDLMNTSRPPSSSTSRRAEPMEPQIFTHKGSPPPHLPYLDTHHRDQSHSTAINNNPRPPAPSFNSQRSLFVHTPAPFQPNTSKPFQTEMSPTQPSSISQSRISPREQTFVTESGESSKRRRGRQATACKDCNRRKQKCDGSMPCTNCMKRGVGERCSFPTTHDGVYSAPTPDSADNVDGKSAKKRKVDPSAPEMMDGPGPSGNDEDNQADESGSYLQLRAKGRQEASLRPDGDETPFYNRIHYSPPRPPSHPVSSERDQAATLPRPPSPNRRETSSDDPRYWRRDKSDEEREVLTAANSVDERSSRGWTETEHLVEEDAIRGFGSLRREKGPRAEEIDSERTFFGTSHFGPQLAAKVIHGALSVPLSDVHRGQRRAETFTSDTKPFTLVSQIRSLIQLLPRRTVCDHLTSQFFARYNDHIDILYKPDFMAKYNKFWNRSFELEAISSIDLRWFSLMLIVLAFGILLDRDTSRDRQENLQDREEMSLSWFWGARRALVEAPSFYGESLDTVRASALVSLYLIVCRRVPEAWTTIGNAIRSAQAQGMHVDGEQWALPPKEAEIRRRLWAQLYIIDRSISLFLGRPLAIQDDLCTVKAPSNIRDDELSSPNVVNRPLSSPTKSTFVILHQKLASVIGRILTSCFGLIPRTYTDVLAAEEMLQVWRRDLPAHFKLEDPDTSLDKDRPWLKPQRHTLCSKFHLARIALHRPYLLRAFEGKTPNEFRASAEACVTSAIADITLRLGLNESDPLDRFKWMTVASGFSPATIIGILCVRRAKDPRIDYPHLLSLLEGYIAVEKTTSRTDESLEAELGVLDLMVQRAKASEEVERVREHRYGQATVAGRGNPGKKSSKGSSNTVSVNSNGNGTGTSNSITSSTRGIRNDGAGTGLSGSSGQTHQPPQNSFPMGYGINPSSVSVPQPQSYLQHQQQQQPPPAQMNSYQPRDPHQPIPHMNPFQGYASTAHPSTHPLNPINHNQISPIPILGGPNVYPPLAPTVPQPPPAAAPGDFSGYTDTGEEWMLPFGSGGQAWVPAPDWDTTASGLPDPGDGKGWQEVMDFVMSTMSSSPNDLLAAQ